MKIYLYRIVVLIFNVILIFLLTGCQNFAANKIVVWKYHLLAVDANEDLSLSYETESGDYISIVNETVFSVGYNNKYIIVKQHPHKFSEVLNKGITNYYIVPIFMKNPLWADREVIGPLTQDQFEQKRKGLNIEDIKFTIVYKKFRVGNGRVMYQKCCLKIKGI